MGRRQKGSGSGSACRGAREASCGELCLLVPASVLGDCAMVSHDVTLGRSWVKSTGDRSLLVLIAVNLQLLQKKLNY